MDSFVQVTSTLYEDVLVQEVEKVRGVDLIRDRERNV